MGFSAQKFRKEKEERPWKVHPAWRGIGCVFIILIPIMAWYTAAIILQYKIPIPIPYSLTRPLAIQAVHVAEIDQIFATFNQYTAVHHLTGAQFFLAAILMVIGFGILSVIYATMYRVAGPSRYGPFDVPPIK
jgi:hypothetical protein